VARKRLLLVHCIFLDFFRVAILSHRRGPFPHPFIPFELDNIDKVNVKPPQFTFACHLTLRDRINSEVLTEFLMLLQRGVPELLFHKFLPLVSEVDDFVVTAMLVPVGDHSEVIEGPELTPVVLTNESEGLPLKFIEEFFNWIRHFENEVVEKTGELWVVSRRIGGRTWSVMLSLEGRFQRLLCVK